MAAGGGNRQLLLRFECWAGADLERWRDSCNGGERSRLSDPEEVRVGILAVGERLQNR